VAFTGRCTITPETGKIPSAQTDYAVLIQAQDNSLKSIANGGLCRTDGFDIRLRSDSGLSSALSQYNLFYDPVNGIFRCRAKIPTLDVGTPYYLGIGDNALSTDPSDAANTFSNNYGLVLPFEDGSTLNVNDVSGNARNGTNVGATAATSILAAGANFDGSNDYIYLPDYSVTGTAITISGVLRTTVNNALKAILIKRPGKTGGVDEVGAEELAFYLTAAGKLQYLQNTGASGSFLTDSVTGATTLSTNTNYVVHARYDGSTAKVYLSGAQDGTASAAGSIWDSVVDIHLGDDGTAGRFFSGVMRMFEISPVARPVDWIATDHHCWSDPSTFASYAYDDAPSGGGGGGGVFNHYYGRFIGGR